MSFVQWLLFILGAAMFGGGVAMVLYYFPRENSLTKVMLGWSLAVGSILPWIIAGA